MNEQDGVVVPSELEHELEQFTGTEAWYPFNLFIKRAYLTDGSRYLAEKAKAYWLMDAIASHQRSLLKRNQVEQKWIVTRQGQGVRLECQDWNGHKLKAQIVPWSNFPLDKCELLAQWTNDESGWMMVIFLPSEY